MSAFPASSKEFSTMERSLVLAFLACVVSLATAQNVGRITGTVLDEHGQIVEAATVCLSETTGMSTTINCQVSTAHGQFQMPKIGFGIYGVFAINEAEGYSIENQSPGQKVRV